MKNLQRNILLVVFLFFIYKFSYNQENTLTNEERKQGWQLLFDGKTTNGWRAFNRDSMSVNWYVQNGVLSATGEKGDIITQNQYENFEFSLEWKISEGGNSGVFYHVKEGKQYDKVWRTGIEMQVMDNNKNPMAKKPENSASSLFAMYAPAKDATKPAGQWNKARIIVEKQHVEYWLNGEIVNRYKLWTDKWYADREKCLHNKKRKPLWGEFRCGHIALQDEGFPVWYRNIKIREINDTLKDKSNPDFLPVTYLDENPPKNRKGHKVHTLLNSWRGTTNGFNSILGIYTANEFVITGTHTHQEMFYVIDGIGWALVGDKVFPIHTGACWFVPPNTKHGIKCAYGCKGVKAFVVHGAP